MDQTVVKNQIRSRRTHRKSRLGCGNCKRRRIKCDEKKPTCSNCFQHSIECDFSIIQITESVSPAASEPGSLAPARSVNRRYRFRSSKYQSHASSPSSGKSDRDIQTRSSIGTQCDLSTSQVPGGVSFADLQLFHNFITSTYSTLGDEAHGYSVWQNHVPQWSIVFPPILHLILALSALHLSHERPELRGQYVMQADDHFTFGVRSVTTVLSQLDAENCQFVYISAVLICFVYFGRGPRPREYLVFSETGRAEWLVLMRGVRFILQSQGDKVFTGILAPTGEESVQHISPSLQSELLEHQIHIQEVLRFVEQRIAEDAGREMYISVINALLQTFEEAYTKRTAQRHGVGLMHIVMGWLYRLPEGFVSLLEQKEPFSLMILAYWSILLKHMRSVWFMKITLFAWNLHIPPIINGMK
ncbi:hypothetical protein VTN77DRAFT_6934 [Rasamsonia byssochlamydoides]|uniref:uncharacterized protein n=1 Tax=Rasamsonia byssochlamydoides TaxID=89139 RepID=UPI0037439867